MGTVTQAPFFVHRRAADAGPFLFTTAQQNPSAQPAPSRAWRLGSECDCCVVCWILRLEAQPIQALVPWKKQRACAHMFLPA